MSAQSTYVIEGPVNWYGLGTLYMKEVWRFLRVPGQTVLAPVATALLMLAIFSLALGGAMRVTEGIPFDQFLAPGLVMMAVIQSSFANTSSSLVMQKIQGNIVDLLMAPLTPIEETAGLVGGGITRGLLTGTILIIALQPFVQLVPEHIGYVLFHAVMAATTLALIGTIGGIWAEKFDHISVVTNFVITPFAFLSGTFYSIERLPETLQTLSAFNPFFYMIDGFRYGFTGVHDGSLGVGIALLAGLNLTLALVCHRIMASGYKLKS